MKERITPEETKERILRVAGEIFGTNGFNGTTIRQITERAGVNVAAVNYHFRDKSELYIRILRETKNWTHETLAFEFFGTPERQLQSFIAAFLRNLLDPDRPQWHVQVISQEMLNPTPALDLLVREMTEPLFRRVRSLVQAVVRVHVSNMELDLLTSSIIGQCLFYVRSRHMIARLTPELSSGPNRIELIAEHVATFSLAALGSLHPQPKTKARARATARA